MIGKFSVKKPYTVLVAVVLVIILGVVSFTKMSADLLPNINLPYVIVMTTYGGASPETIETVVTKPIEASMATVSNIENISSVSNESYSLVILEFAQTTNMDSVSLEIREKLDQLDGFWDDSVGKPAILKLNPNMMPVMIAAVGTDNMNHAQVSDYAENTIIPELESLEGVASVNGTGLIEESVNVIIRKDKIDAVNEKVFAAIDSKMADAEKELADGKKEILKSKQEMADARAEIENGRKELTDGKAELDKGKQELDAKKTDVTTQLATNQTQLLTAKADLEAAKTSITTEIGTIQALKDNLAQVNKGYKELKTGIEGMQKTIESLPTLAFAAGMGSEEAIQGIGTMKQEILKNTSGDVKKALKKLDWTKPAEVGTAADTVKEGTVCGYLNSVVAQMNTSLTTLEQTKSSLETSLSVKTSGMGADEYSKLLNSNLAEINGNIAKVDAGLLEISKGNLTAAVEFSNANTQIELGKYQMTATEAQLDSAMKQLEEGEDKLKDALKQIEDGEKQFADAKQDAYEKADMQGVLTEETIKGLLTAQNFSMPAGYITEEGISYLVRVGDKPETVEEMAAMPLLNLNMEGVDVVTLGDVADVFYTDNADEIYTNLNGNPGVMLSIQKQTGYATGEVSDRLNDKFAALMEEDQGLTITPLMDQGIYIDLVMDSIFNNIIFGAILAILILIVFLRDLRPTLVIACSIPISLVTAIVCMYFSGVTLNVISLSGLALGIGMLVDNSIVVIENIYRLRGEGYSMTEAAIEGTKEVAGAIAASTLTTICVFAPIVFTEGITRQLFVDMGLTIAYSLLASLVIAMTVVPAMSSKVLRKSNEQKEGKVYHGFVNGYDKLLKGCLKVKPIVFVGVIVLLGASVAAALSRGTGFMPSMDSTQLAVNVKLEEGASLIETEAVTDKVVQYIRQIPDVKDVGAMSSGSNMSMLMGGGSSGTNSASIYVTTVDDKTMSNDEIAKIITEKTKGLKAEITVQTSNMDMSMLGGSGISIEVRGREMDELRRIAEEVAAIVEQTEGTAEVSDGLEESTEELRVHVDKQKAMDHGLTVAQVFAQLNQKLSEAKTASVLSGEEKDYNVYLLREEDDYTRKLIQDKMEIETTNADGKKEKILLSEIADFEAAKGLSSIYRTEQTRYINVTAGIAEGYNVGLVTAQVEKKLADYQMPAGYSLKFSGENETINDAMQQLLLMLVLAIAFMYLIMVAQFQSLLSPFIIMFTIPLAFTGGFMGLYVSHSEVSVIAMIGFVMLSGVIVNNGIVIIDYMNQLRAAGMAKKEAILQAGRTRLRPVLMTALTTILALCTLVFSHDMGAEMAKPMAIVTVGGLVYGTLLTLIVIPCLYDAFMREKKIKE